MLLSALSALARLDRDPWREAAELARMPQQTASQRLTFLIKALPNQPPTRPEPETISTRLIALLPRGASPSVASSEKLPGGAETLNFRALIYVMLLNLLLMACMTDAQWITSSADSSTKIDSAQASSASAVHPLKSPQRPSP
jgi:hypothetical protein